jgi:hypothetical protein
LGTDDRVESGQLTDPNLPFAAATGAMWLASLIHDNGYGTSRITTTPYTSNAGQPLCTDTKFYNQPVGNGLGCTAFFIAPDMVATANHCLSHWGWSWNNWRIVLDWANSPSTSFVPTSHIYNPIALVATGANPQDDWAVLQVTPPLEDTRATLPLSPTISTLEQFQTFSTSVATLGYGNGLPLKYSPNGSAYTFGGNDYFLTDLDIFPGNSGSPVFDTATSMTLGVLYGDFGDDYVLDTTANCYRLATYPDDHYLVDSETITWAQPIANLVAPAGAPIEPTWRGAMHLNEGPAAVALTNGNEYVFGAGNNSLMYKQRNTQTTWSPWTLTTGGYISTQPAAVEGFNDIWMFTTYQGNLMYAYRTTGGSWSKWAPITTPSPLVLPPAAFSFDTPGPNGMTTRVIVVAMVGYDGVGRMFNLTYQFTGSTFNYAYVPGGTLMGSQISPPWQSGAFALVSGTPGVVTGFGTTDDASGIATIPTVVSGAKVLACARATLSGPNAPNQPATIGWSACPQAYPSNLTVQSAQGVALAGGTQYLVGRGADDANLVSTRTGSTAAWSPWTAFGGRNFAKPVITKSLGTWWTYTMAADRRVAVNQTFLP